jgi:hypothetical protein
MMGMMMMMMMMDDASRPRLDFHAFFVSLLPLLHSVVTCSKPAANATQHPPF